MTYKLSESEYGYVATCSTCGDSSPVPDSGDRARSRWWNPGSYGRSVTGTRGACWSWAAVHEMEQHPHYSLSGLSGRCSCGFDGTLQEFADHRSHLYSYPGIFPGPLAARFFGA